MDNSTDNYNKIKCINTVFALKKSRLDVFYELLHIKQNKEEPIFTKGKTYSYRKGIHGLFMLANDEKWWFVNNNSLVNNFLLDTDAD
jgi:hypothetical protein